MEILFNEQNVQGKNQFTLPRLGYAVFHVQRIKKDMEAQSLV